MANAPTDEQQKADGRKNKAKYQGISLEPQKQQELVAT
jgi:hypothetical protein